MAFSTSSSSGTLPVSIECARKNLGVSEGVAGFVLPVGATINMDGTAIYQGVLALFIAQAFGIELNGGQYLMIILTATLASIGTAGVPGAGLIMLGLVLTSVGLPLEGVALIAGIDRILDMARTTVNVAGDLMTTTLVGRSENELDQAIYNSDNPQSRGRRDQGQHPRQDARGAWAKPAHAQPPAGDRQPTRRLSALRAYQQ